MKNLLKIVLAAALIFSMTACNNEAQIENNESAVLEFDKNWATKIGISKEMLIPEPPFPVECPRIIGVFETTEPLPENAIEEIQEYCNLLEKIGYNIDVVSEFIESDTGDSPEYRFEARNSEYVYVTVSYYNNSMIIYYNALNTPQNEESDNVPDPVTPEEPENTEPENTGSEVPETPTFDTAWASNNYEKLLPKPPFDGWSGTMKDTNVYELFTSEAKIGDSLSYYDVWQEYLDLLKSLGFSVEGEVYSSIAYDTMGNKFKLKCGDGCAWITFSPVEQLG